MKEFFLKIWPVLKNKYVITISVFGIWMLFFDQNNMVDRMRMSAEDQATGGRPGVLYRPD